MIRCRKAKFDKKAIFSKHTIDLLIHNFPGSRKEPKKIEKKINFVFPSIFCPKG